MIMVILCFGNNDPERKEKALKSASRYNRSVNKLARQTFGQVENGFP